MFCWNADASIVLFQPCSLLAGFCRKQCLFTSTNSRLGVLLIFLRLYLGTASAAFSTFTSFLGAQLEAVWKLPWLGLTLQLQAWLALETSSEGSFLHLERYVIIGVATWTFWDNALVKEFYGQPSCKRQCRGIVDFCVCVKIRITAGEVHLGTKEITDHLYPCFFHTWYCYVFPLLASSVSSLDLIQNCGNSLGSPVCKWDSTWVHFVAFWLDCSSFLPQV